MTTVLSWNIQNGRGVDGVISLERIAGVIGEMGGADVICLQEVSRHLSLSEGDGAPDQVAQLSALFPDYSVVFGAAVEVSLSGSELRWQFGNATLTRLPVLSVFRHHLPQPAEPGIRHMPRQATEVTVSAAADPLRIINTHLEFHSIAHRLAQVLRLREIVEEPALNVLSPPQTDPSGPYQYIERPAECVLCGDFNFLQDSPEYRLLCGKLGDPAHLIDLWPVTNGEKPHDLTCGVHDHLQWPQGPHCRDFFFSTDCVAAGAAEVIVNTVTDASDHQPLKAIVGRK